MRCAHTDWVHNRLTVTGPAERVRAFRIAARGCGAVPWVLDYDQLEELTIALILREPPERRLVGLEGAKAIAREWRDFVQDGTEQVHSVVGVSTNCPFDLHSLVPVPWPILCLRPNHPDAVDWLWRHWGTTWTLRRVEELEVTQAERERIKPGDAVASYRFWSADWTPWQALLRIRDEWPALTLRLLASAEPPAPIIRRRGGSPAPESLASFAESDPLQGQDHRTVTGA